MPEGQLKDTLLADMENTLDKILLDLDKIILDLQADKLTE